MQFIWQSNRNRAIEKYIEQRTVRVTFQLSINWSFARIHHLDDSMATTVGQSCIHSFDTGLVTFLSCYIACHRYVLNCSVLTCLLSIDDYLSLIMVISIQSIVTFCKHVIRCIDMKLIRIICQVPFLKRWISNE
jgi:hypothetical protein